MKKFILSLGLSLFGLISFSNAGSVTYTGQLNFTNFGSSDNNYLFYFGIPNTTNSLNTPVYIDCYFYNISNLNSDFQVKPQGYIYYGNSVSRYYPATADPTDVKANNYHYTFEKNDLVTFGLVNKVSGFTNSFDYSCTFSGLYIHGGSCPACEECQTCPEVDTGAILSGYIDIEDITTNYCVSNDLCPEMSGGNSAIYINDIRHESMPFINIRIPEEIERTYEYTGNNTQLDISVEGYGYDQEKMQNMINTQYYTPTSEEMSSLIGKIADFLPLIAIALLIIRIRRVLKKVFRF